MSAQPAPPFSAPGYLTRTSFIAGLQTANPSDWDRLIRLYQPLLWHWARQEGVSPQDFDDVCQDVFRVVVARIGAFVPRDQTGAFRSWLRAITRNVCRERRHATPVEGSAAGGSEAVIRLREVPGVDVESDDPPALVGALHRQAMALVRGEFSDTYWQVFERLTVGEQQPAEVASEMGLTADYVRTIKCRIRKRLNEELGDVAGGPRRSVPK